MPWSVTSVDDDSRQNKETMSGKKEKKVPFRTRDGSTETKNIFDEFTSNGPRKGFLQVILYFSGEKKEKNFGFEHEKKLRSWTKE